MALEVIERQAKHLAIENRRSEPDIERVYWFPAEGEVRLVEVTEIIPRSLDGRVTPYYFLASPADDLPAPSGIAMIRPDEFGRLKLPEKWGDWEEAVLIEPRMEKQE